MAAQVNRDSAPKDAQAILAFLIGVDKQRFGTGLAYYDEAGFMIKPRSEYFSNQTYQWVVNIGNRGATFEKVQEAFLKLKSRIEALIAKIPANPAENPSIARKLLLTLVEIQKVVDGVSREGLKRLSENYRANATKAENASSLLGIGEDCFNLLKSAETALETKMTATDPTIASDVQLVRYAFSAKDLLIRREKYRQTLRHVVCDDNGLVIPFTYVKDAFFDAKHLFQHARGAVFNAACAIKMPQMALPIPAQGGTAEWTPLRLSNSSENTLVEQGVTGVCEKSTNLSTFYYLISSLTKLLTVSCGVPDSPQKLDQLVLGLREIRKRYPDQKFTSCAVLQLNSFSTEAPLIRNMQLNIPKLQQELKLTTLLHFNISYRSEKEDEKSGLIVNLDGLALLTCTVLNEVKNLLSEPPTPELQTSSSASSRLISEEIPDNVQIQNLRHLFNEKGPVNVQVQELSRLFNLRWRSNVAHTDRILAGTYNDFQENVAKILIESTLPTLQQILEKANHVYDKEKSCRFGKLSLLLYSLSELLSAQLGVGKTNLQSRCQTVEMFLFLLRMLKIPVVLVSGDGINRGGAVRALVDAQCQLEKELYDEAFSNSVAHDKKEDALMQAQVELFNLIKNLEGNRYSVLEDIEHSFKRSSLPVISDLKTFVKLVDEKLRPVLSMKIMGFADHASADPLRLTLRYLEFAGASLLGPQAEIALFGKGVVGYKFDQDAYWAAQRYYANNLPLERCPPLIRTNGHFIKLYQYSAGSLLASPSLTLTPAGRDIILRLGQQD
ncbi:MAG TPA: hypothetical protein VHK67_02315 [Rhabdochlamydiaceae bacterium]|nr:hypothetical protein [Rhabdochlamydiaceae bacterium]